MENENHLFPAFLKLEHMRVLLVGGGNVGLEKLEAILRNSPGVKIKIVADYFRTEVEALAADNQNIQLIRRKFEWQDLDQVEIVFLATDNRSLHEEIVEIAHQKKLLVNVADTPYLCDFYLSSVVQKGHLKIAISTNGKSPTLAKRIREYLTEMIPEGSVQTLIDNLTDIRAQLKDDFEFKVKKLNEVTSSWMRSHAGQRSVED